MKAPKCFRSSAQKAQPPRQPWQHDKSSHERGYGHAWRKLRRKLLDDEPLCRLCKQAGRVAAATSVDHIKPKMAGGGDQITNLQPLCEECHQRKSSREGRTGRGYGGGEKLSPTPARPTA